VKQEEFEKAVDSRLKALDEFVCGNPSYADAHQFFKNLNIPKRMEKSKDLTRHPRGYIIVPCVRCAADLLIGHHGGSLNNAYARTGQESSS
jgi:hypothetical protein